MAQRERLVPPHGAGYGVLAGDVAEWLKAAPC